MYLLLLIIEIIISTAYNVQATNSQELEPNYKLSMVSSPDNPGHPAIFEHAKSPVWDPDQQNLYFVDVSKRNVHRLDYVSGKIYVKHIGYGELNAVAIVSGTRRLLVCVRSAMYLLDWDVAGDDDLRLIVTLDQGLPDNVINVGKPDAAGRFWAGTKGPQSGDEVVPDKATLYRIEQGSITHPRVLLRPVSISSGLVWSPNNTVLYYIDSLTLKIEAFDFDLVTGEISARRTIMDFSSNDYDGAMPDGMTIDSQGRLWVALLFGGTVLHIDPDTRKVIYTYKLPVSRITSVCWGGPNLDELFVTTAQEKAEPKSEPLGGAIFTIRDTGYRGLPPNTFRFDNADNY